MNIKVGDRVVVRFKDISIEASGVVEKCFYNRYLADGNKIVHDHYVRVKFINRGPYRFMNKWLFAPSLLTVVERKRK